MTKEEDIKAIAAEALAPAISPGRIEDILVREDEGAEGEAVLFIEVVVGRDAPTPDVERWLDARLRLSERLVAAGEHKFPLVSITDLDERRAAELVRMAAE